MGNISETLPRIAAKSSELYIAPGTEWTLSRYYQPMLMVVLIIFLCSQLWVRRDISLGFRCLVLDLVNYQFPDLSLLASPDPSSCLSKWFFDPFASAYIKTFCGYQDAGLCMDLKGLHLLLGGISWFSFSSILSLLTSVDLKKYAIKNTQSSFFLLQIILAVMIIFHFKEHFIFVTVEKYKIGSKDEVSYNNEFLLNVSY